MTQPINLNKARKAKARVEKDQRAAENRVKFGRTKAERQRDEMANKASLKSVDDAKRED